MFCILGGRGVLSYAWDWIWRSALAFLFDIRSRTELGVQIQLGGFFGLLLQHTRSNSLHIIQHAGLHQDFGARFSLRYPVMDRVRCTDSIRVFFRSVTTTHKSHSLYIIQHAGLDLVQFRVQLVPDPFLGLGPFLAEHEVADLGHLAVAQILPVAVLAPADRIHQRPGPFLRRPPHDPELQLERGRGVAEQVRGAEARVQQVEGDEGFASGRGEGGGEGAAVEDLEELAVEVAGRHLGHGAVAVVERVEDAGLRFRGQVDEVVDRGADDGDAGGGAEGLG